MTPITITLLKIAAASACVFGIIACFIEIDWKAMRDLFQTILALVAIGSLVGMFLRRNFG